MRVPTEVHTSGAWRIREIAPDFVVEDVWSLPARGRAGDFSTLVELMSDSEPVGADSLPLRVLWRTRDLLGKWFGLGRITMAAEDSGGGDLAIPGAEETSLEARLPADLRGTAADVQFGTLPFRPLYRTDREFAAEISNKTVHGIMHLAWADAGGEVFQGQMAVYVKPRGTFGQAYLAFIKPFRYAIVYPALMRQVERTWRDRGPAMAP